MILAMVVTMLISVSMVMFMSVLVLVPVPTMIMIMVVRVFMHRSLTSFEYLRIVNNRLQEPGIRLNALVHKIDLLPPA